MKKALVIIDMQIMPFIWKDYGGKALHNEDLLLSNAKLLIEKARKAQAPIIYIMHTETGQSHRAEGQPLWQVHPEIAPQPIDKLIIKYHADSFLKTELLSLLTQEEIEELMSLNNTGLGLKLIIELIKQYDGILEITNENYIFRWHLE